MTDGTTQISDPAETRNALYRMVDTAFAAGPFFVACWRLQGGKLICETQHRGIGDGDFPAIIRQCKAELIKRLRARIAELEAIPNTPEEKNADQEAVGNDGDSALGQPVPNRPRVWSEGRGQLDAPPSDEE